MTGQSTLLDEKTPTFKFSTLNIFRKVDRGQRKKIYSVLRLQRKLDLETAKFQSLSALKCVSGCGHCCENPHVETTVLEMLPLAVEFWRRNEAENFLKEFSEDESKGICHFYRPDPLREGQGRCSVYPLRPLLCRLFGFAGRVNKNGRTEFMTCSVIKSSFPGNCRRTQGLLDKGLAIPLTADYAMQLYQIDPQWSSRRFPINQAFKIALEKVGLLLELSGQK